MAETVSRGRGSSGRPAFRQHRINRRDQKESEKGRQDEPVDDDKADVPTARGAGPGSQGQGERG